LRDTPEAPFLQEIGNTDFNQVVCGIQAPPEEIWMCHFTSNIPAKTGRIISKWWIANGAFPGYYRWVWYAT
jgi:hypothetical protein